MGLPLIEKRALKRLEPTILTGHEMFFFSFLSQKRSSYKKTVKSEKLFLDFIDFLSTYEDANSMLRAHKLMKKGMLNIKSTFEKNLKKLDGIFWYIDVNHRIEFLLDDKEATSFYRLLKHIQKSDQRIVRWIIAYLFYKGKKKIEISDFKKYSKLVKTDLEKHIKKIWGNKWALVSGILSLKSKHGSIIDLKIDHQQDDKRIERFLLDELEFISKRPAGDIETDILELLDNQAMSLKQLSKTLDVSSPQLSPIFKKLRKEKQIRHASDGIQGERFFITNCDNCFRNIEKDKCRSDAIEEIIQISKESLNLKIDGKTLDESFRDNQSMLNFARTMHENSRVKDTEIYPNYQEGLQGLFVWIYENYVRNVNPEGEKLVKLDDLFVKLGDSFTPGFLIGKIEMGGLLQRAMDNVGVKFTPTQERKIRDEIDRLLNEAN